MDTPSLAPPWQTNFLSHFSTDFAISWLHQSTYPPWFYQFFVCIYFSVFRYYWKKYQKLTSIYYYSRVISPQFSHFYLSFSIKRLISCSFSGCCKLFGYSSSYKSSSSLLFSLFSCWPRYFTINWFGIVLQQRWDKITKHSYYKLLMMQWPSSVTNIAMESWTLIIDDWSEMVY